MHTNIMIAILETTTGIMAIIILVGGKITRMGTDGGLGNGGGSRLERAAILADTLMPTLRRPNHAKKGTSHHTQDMMPPCHTARKQPSGRIQVSHQAIGKAHKILSGDG
jgi:hypothetical protein